jgi:DNA-binding GntR family transcriptional regulator
LSKISEELTVSSTAVRSAAVILINEGLAETQHNQGFFASKLNVKELNDIITARKIIEANSAKILCDKITKEQINSFHNILDLMKNSLRQNDYANYINLEIAFHSSIVNLSDNKYLISMFNNFIDVLKRYGKYMALNLYDFSKLKTAYRQHLCIVDSLENSMIDNVDILIKRHINDFEKAVYYSDSRFNAR